MTLQSRSYSIFSVVCFIFHQRYHRYYMYGQRHRRRSPTECLSANTIIHEAISFALGNIVVASASLPSPPSNSHMIRRRKSPLRRTHTHLVYPVHYGAGTSYHLSSSNIHYCLRCPPFSKRVSLRFIICSVIRCTMRLDCLLYPTKQQIHYYKSKMGRMPKLPMEPPGILKCLGLRHWLFSSV